jgi:hypothetical protein
MRPPPGLRLHGVRAGESGFVAVQSRREGVDIVDIYAVPPSMLGAVIAESFGLVGAGAHPRIAVTAGDDRLPDPPEAVDEYDDLGLSITHVGPREAAVVVDGRDVAAIGTVQSRNGPASHWGTDPGLPILRWVEMHGDGDYLYEADGDGYLEPLTTPMLIACIEGLIADVTRW